MDYGNPKPISILPVLSEVLEEAVDLQENEFFNTNVQSGLQADQKSESTVSHIIDDLLRDINNNQVTALILLEYSRSFNTLIMFSCLFSTIPLALIAIRLDPFLPTYRVGRSRFPVVVICPIPLQLYLVFRRLASWGLRCTFSIP